MIIETRPSLPVSTAAIWSAFAPYIAPAGTPPTDPSSPSAEPELSTQSGLWNAQERSFANPLFGQRRSDTAR